MRTQLLPLRSSIEPAHAFVRSSNDFPSASRSRPKRLRFQVAVAECGLQPYDWQSVGLD
jgi:hypothetical protein